MNNVLFEHIKSLNDEDLRKCKQHFSDSSYVLKAIDFVLRSDEKYFKNQKIVAELYDSEKEKAGYSVLENRYYKIRKRLLNYFAEQNTRDKTSLLSEEEEELLQLTRKHTNSTNNQLFKRKVAGMEARFWENNLFELLVVLYDYLLQLQMTKGFNMHSLLKKYTRANELLQDIHTIKRYRYLMAELTFKYGAKASTEYLDKIKYLASKNRQQKRFEFIYYYLFIIHQRQQNKIDSTGKLITYLKKCERIMDNNPEIPLFEIGTQYPLLTKVRLNSLLSGVYRLAGNYEKALSLLDEEIRVSKTALKISDELLIKTYQHRVFCLIRLRKYAAAWKELYRIFDFIAPEDKVSETINYYYMALCVSFSFPHSPIKKYDFLIDRLQGICKNPSSGISKNMVNYIAIVLSKLFIMTENYPKALKLIEREDVRLEISSIMDYSIITNLYRILAQRKFKELIVYQAKLQKQLHKSDDARLVDELNWLRIITNYLIKKHNLTN